MITSTAAGVKYERLNHLADVGGADHADDRTVRVAARAEDYVTADTDEGGWAEFG